RAKQALEKVPGAEAILSADLASIAETKELAAKVNALGRFDAIIHNAGVYNVSGNSPDGLPLVFAVNSIAPYILTCLIGKPKRLIYLSSDMHLGADPKLGNLSGVKTSKNISYSDTKYHNVILAMAVAERWKDVYSNALNPGWVPTKMGGAGAPDNLEKGYHTQVWLAESNDKEALVSGQYFYHKKLSRFLEAARDMEVQERFLKICEEITGVHFLIR
ncbi:MAG: daunorubicin C-13 ketoreductase, partial [Bacteroidia bacterium]|nr:daunorubicin C-13 ketoreductase [Bacteroidia bacterium]